ncbi:MAG: SDR family NAD(P)-dependent oxidoreductase [Acidimicrobiales bacterium]
MLVTGATSGIGRATAAAFAREGAHVVALGRHMVAGRRAGGPPDRADRARWGPTRCDRSSCGLTVRCAW